MLFRIIGLVSLLAWSCLGASKAPPSARGSNDNIEVEAKLYLESDEIEQLIGHKMEKGIVVVELKITPRNGKPFQVWHDDFVLRSDKDGQKSEPYDPGQIASNTVLTLIYSSDGGGVAQQENGPVWGGTGGQEPSRLPGSGGGFGNMGSVEQASRSVVTEDKEAQQNPLLVALREKVLKEDEIAEATTGLLYFPLEGKHKIKQIWLYYTGEDGRIDMRFQKND